jgi:hypothetical protein
LPQAFVNLNVLLDLSFFERKLIETRWKKGKKDFSDEFFKKAEKWLKSPPSKLL